MEDLFGNTGKVDASENEKMKDDYTTIPDVPISALTDRVQPHSIASGVMRGTQRIVNTDGSTITLGVIPETNGDFGIATFTAQNELMYKLVGNEWTWFDLSTGKPRVSITATEDDFSFKVAQRDFDVTTAADNELVFNSANNLFKIVDTGTGTFPNASATTVGVGFAGDVQTTEITHNLGYTPLIIAAVTISPTQYEMLPYTTMSQDGAAGANIVTYSLGVDSTRILVTTNVLIYRTGADTLNTGGYTFKYYLLRETAN